MSYNHFLDDIKNNNLKKAYLCYGTEKYMIDWIITEVKNKYVDKSFESLNYVYLDGKNTNVDDIINACETLPFMSEKKVVIVEDLPIFTGTKGTSSFDEDRLNEYIHNLNDLTCLIFIVNNEKIDNRRKIIKGIKNIGSVIEFSKIKGDDLNKWISKMFKKYHKKITKADIGYFVENIGYLDTSTDKTLYDLENEIVKICNYTGSKVEITKEDIERVLVKTLQNNIFKLVDEIGQKNIGNALKNLNEMVLSNEPLQLVFHMIIRQFRLLLMAKLLEQKGYSFSNIVEKMGVHSFTAKKVLSQSRNFTETELEMALNYCLELDRSIKKGNIDNRLAIEMLIIKISK